VRDATLDTAAALVAERGLHAVTMSEIAEKTGIGRATLYKYFPDVESILFAWHERQLASHLQQLVDVRDRASDPGERFAAVLEAYALIHHQLRHAHATELAAIVHRGDHLVRAEHHLRALVREVLDNAVRAGKVRADLPTDELATYCINALSAASSLPSKSAVRRLVTVVLDGLGPAHRALAGRRRERDTVAGWRQPAIVAPRSRAAKVWDPLGSLSTFNRPATFDPRRAGG